MQGSIGQLGKISIHALREEGDVMPFADHLRLINFYPRPPRGGRPDESATEELIRAISIHALREEGDLWMATTFQPAFDFYPRPPRGGRHKLRFERVTLCPFLSTPSARRATALRRRI